jgi:hypothetical protein
MAVAHYELGRKRALAPRPAADVPAVQVSRDLDLLSHRPKGAGPEVELHRAEPVPTTGHGPAHGKAYVRQHRLLGGVGVDRLRKREDDGLSHAHGDPRARENAGRDRYRRRRRGKGAGASGLQAMAPRHLVADRVGGTRPQPARRAPFVCGQVEGPGQDNVVRRGKDMDGRQPLVSSLDGDHRREALVTGPVGWEQHDLGQKLVHLGLSGCGGGHAGGCRR